MSRPCPGCGVEPDHIHEWGCDVERCAECGWQPMWCGCHKHRPSVDTPPATRRLPWKGRWPGSKEAEEANLWCRWVDNEGNETPLLKPGKWEACERDTPGARLDYSRFNLMFEWNKHTQQWEKRAEHEAG